MQRARDADLRPTIVRAVILGLIASAIGIVLGLAIHWFPTQGSTQAKKIDDFWDVLLIVSIPIFVLVASTVIVSVIKFRVRPGEEDLDGPPIHGNTRLEVIWTSVPTVLIAALCVYAYVVLHDIEKAPANGRELNVNVIGQQFTWHFEYPLANGKKVASDQLYVPQGESVKFHIQSKDVLHDFWVPAWRMKIDAVPGITTSYRITPVKLGTFPVVCAELCGLGHAFMRQTAHVLPSDKFQAWLDKQANPQPASGGGAQPSGGGGTSADTAQGKQVFANNGCSACHTLSDAGANAKVGPDLDKVLASVDKPAILKDITDPNAEIAKGFAKDIMPQDFGTRIQKADLDALVNYLYTVTHK